MVRRHYISNRNWWKGIGFAALTLTVLFAALATIDILIAWTRGACRLAQAVVWEGQHLDRAVASTSKNLATWLSSDLDRPKVWLARKVITVAEARALAADEQARSLHFYCCSFEDGALRELASYSHLEALEMQSCHGDFESLRAFAKSAPLKALTFVDSPLTLETAQAIGTIRSLESLSLAQCAVDRAKIEALAGLPAIAWLSVHATPVASRDLEALTRLPNLRYLDVSRTRVGDDFIPTIERMPWLRELYAGIYSQKWQFTRAGIDRLRRACPHLVIPYYRYFLFPPEENCCGYPDEVPWRHD